MSTWGNMGQHGATWGYGFQQARVVMLLRSTCRARTHPRYTVSYHFITNLKAVELGPLVAEGVRMLHGAGLTVAYTVCDGASENRAWQQMMADSELAKQVAQGVCANGAEKWVLLRVVA